MILNWKPSSFIAKDGKVINFQVADLDIKAIRLADMNGSTSVDRIYIQRFSRNTKFMFDTSTGLEEYSIEDGMPDVMGTHHVYATIPNEYAEKHMETTLLDFIAAVVAYSKEHASDAPDYLDDPYDEIYGEDDH